MGYDRPISRGLLRKSAIRAFCSSPVLLGCFLSSGAFVFIMPVLFGQMIFDIVCEALDTGLEWV